MGRRGEDFPAEAGVECRWVKDSLEQTGLVAERMKGRHPNPIAEAVCSLFDKDEARHVDHLEKAVKLDLQASNLNNQPMEMRCSGGARRRAQIDSRVVREIKDDRALNGLASAIAFDPNQSLLQGCKLFPVRRELVNERVSLAKPHSQGLPIGEETGPPVPVPLPSPNVGTCWIVYEVLVS
jgi:hypothetical protein